MEGAPDSPPNLRVGWEFVRLARTGITSLEERTTRIIPAQVAGLIALWTALHSFDSGVPRALAWAAWGVLLVGVAAVARLVTPRRLARFWDDLVPERVTRIPASEEPALVEDLAVRMQRQMERLQVGLQIAVSLSGLAIVLAGAGYLIEKTWSYAGGLRAPGPVNGRCWTNLR